MGLFGPNVEKMAANRDVNGLIDVLASGNDKQRERAAQALVSMGEDAVRPLMARIEAVGEPAENALAMVGPPALGPVVDALHAGQTRYLNTLSLMCIVGVPGALTAMRDLAQSGPDEFQREAARDCLDLMVREFGVTIPACGHPTWPKGDEKLAAIQRLQSLQGTPVAEWRTCPACQSPLSRRVAHAVQCVHCSRCFTDPGFQPVVSTGTIDWGRLEGSKPWRPLLMADTDRVGKSQAWMPMPPNYPKLVYEGFLPDDETFEFDSED